MESYHGTDQKAAKSIAGPPTNVDVSLGGGELGQGFYTGENIALAAALAKGKAGEVLKIDIDDSDFINLKVKTIHEQKVVRNLFDFLKKHNTTKRFKFRNTDVVCAPFATIDFAYQYKFQSDPSENTLNNSKITIL